MEKEYIKEVNGTILGWITTEPNGDKTAHDFLGRILGRYIARYNHTTDFFGRVVAQGDAVVSFIYKNANQ